MSLRQVSEILGGKKVIGKELVTQMDLVELGRKGISKDALLHLSKYISSPLGQMASLLPVTERTLSRYTLKDRMAPMVSEQVMQIAEVVARGVEVFEGKDRFVEWLKQPSKALGGEKPLSLLDSRFGIEMVLDELGRIEYGVYA